MSRVWLGFYRVLVLHSPKALSYPIFIISSLDATYSEISEPELSDTLNTIAFGATTHANAWNLPNAETANDTARCGRLYLP